MPEIFVCDFPNCVKTFRRSYDFGRHQRRHCTFEEREFGCPYHGCGFRANQRGGLRIHVNSIHEKIGLSCGIQGCMKTFTDPSSRTRHRQSVHHVGGRAGRQRHGYVTATASDGKSNAHHFDGIRPPASHVASLQPPSSVRRPNDAQSPHCGGFHPAVDVPPDRWSIDNHNQVKHQAYDANPQDPPPGHHPYRPVPSGSHLPQPRMGHLSRTVDEESCHCLDDSLTLAPLQGHYQGDQSEAPLFSYPTTGHVPPSDQRSRLPPTANHHPYPRPNLRMLF